MRERERVERDETRERRELRERERVERDDTRERRELGEIADRDVKRVLIEIKENDAVYTQNAVV